MILLPCASTIGIFWLASTAATIRSLLLLLLLCRRPLHSCSSGGLFLCGSGDRLLCGSGGRLLCGGGRLLCCRCISPRDESSPPPPQARAAPRFPAAHGCRASRSSSWLRTTRGGATRTSSGDVRRCTCSAASRSTRPCYWLRGEMRRSSTPVRAPRRPRPHRPSAAQVAIQGGL